MEPSGRQPILKWLGAAILAVTFAGIILLPFRQMSVLILSPLLAYIVFNPFLSYIYGRIKGTEAAKKTFLRLGYSSVIVLCVVLVWALIVAREAARIPRPHYSLDASVAWNQNAGLFEVENRFRFELFSVLDPREFDNPIKWLQQEMESGDSFISLSEPVAFEVTGVRPSTSAFNYIVSVTQTDSLQVKPEKKDGFFTRLTEIRSEFPDSMLRETVIAQNRDLSIDKTASLTTPVGFVINHNIRGDAEELIDENNEDVEFVSGEVFQGTTIRIRHVSPGFDLPVLYPLASWHGWSDWRWLPLLLTAVVGFFISAIVDVKKDNFVKKRIEKVMKIQNSESD